MKQVFQDALSLMGAGITVSLLATGCVTSSDLTKLNEDLTHKLDGYTKTMRSEVGRLHEQIKSLRTETEGLRAQVGTLQLNTTASLDMVKEQGVISQQALRDLSTVTIGTKKEVENYAGKAREHFGKIEEMTGENTKQIRTVQQVVSGFSSRIDHFPSLVSAIGTEVRSLTETLRGTYELEEGGLRDRLRAIEEMRKRLRPFEASQQTGPALQK
jgi:archaellum component FlaC